MAIKPFGLQWSRRDGPKMWGASRSNMLLDLRRCLRHCLVTGAYGVGSCESPDFSCHATTGACSRHQICLESLFEKYILLPPNRCFLPWFMENRKVDLVKVIKKNVSFINQQRAFGTSSEGELPEGTYVTHTLAAFGYNQLYEGAGV